MGAESPQVLQGDADTGAFQCSIRANNNFSNSWLLLTRIRFIYTAVLVYIYVRAYFAQVPVCRNMSTWIFLGFLVCEKSLNKKKAKNQYRREKSLVRISRNLNIPAPTRINSTDNDQYLWLLSFICMSRT